MLRFMIFLFATCTLPFFPGADAGTMKETKKRGRTAPHRSLIPSPAPAAAPSSTSVCTENKAILITQHYSRPIYGIPFDEGDLRRYLRRLEIALRASDYGHVSRQLVSGRLLFVYVSSVPRLLEKDPIMDLVLIRTPAAVTRQNGVTYVLIKKHYFDRMSNYGRDVVLAHEVGHVLYNHFGEGDIRKFSTCSEHGAVREEQLADILAGRVFANISYYHHKNRSSRQAWRQLEGAFRTALAPHGVSADSVDARIRLLQKGFAMSPAW